MKASDGVRLFGLNNLIIESEIKNIEDRFAVDLGHVSVKKQEQDKLYYPQFSQKLRDESEYMAIHYSVFYCLENTIRKLITDRMIQAFGADWWNKPDVVPVGVVKNCDDNRKREIASGFTRRSEDMIDYSNFGELGEIIRNNWDHFDEIFLDEKAVNKIFASLNTLRAPIAHCKVLAEDEVLRLHLALRDWFRQMGS